MELSWLTRIRVTAVLALGIAVCGMYIWDFVAPADPIGAVILANSNITATNVALTILIALAVGFAAYFISWPYGREIGILAVPAGLAAWAVRSGEMASLMQTHAAVQARHDLYQNMSWEGFVWLAISAAGYAGTMTAATLVPSSGVLPEFEPHKTKPQFNLQSVATLGMAAAIAAVGISLFAKDVIFSDKNLGTVLGQPSGGQAAFAAMVSFGLAAFIVKRFWDASYIWPAIATAIVAFAAMNLGGRRVILDYMTAKWPAIFFGQPLGAMLPIQIVSFGIIGSITGYWLAVRFKYWQTHHAK
jgi:hypothetical protein